MQYLLCSFLERWKPELSLKKEEKEEEKERRGYKSYLIEQIRME